MNYEDGFGWGGPNHMMTDIYKNEHDKWNELIAWEDKTNIVSFLMVSSDDVRDYYGDDRFKAYPDGAPQTTKLNLTFKELEIITKTYIDQGF